MRKSVGPGELKSGDDATGFFFCGGSSGAVCTSVCSRRGWIPVRYPGTSAGTFSPSGSVCVLLGPPAVCNVPVPALPGLVDWLSFHHFDRPRYLGRLSTYLGRYLSKPSQLNPTPMSTAAPNVTILDPVVWPPACMCLLWICDICALHVFKFQLIVAATVSAWYGYPA